MKTTCARPLGLAVAVLLAGCTAPAKPALAAGQPTPARAPPAAMTTSPTPALDWDGTHWDAGNVVGITREGGERVVIFDRYGLYGDGDGLKEAKQLTREPLVYANSDYPYVNQNPKLRRYVLAQDAQVLEITNTHEICRARFAQPPQKAEAPRFVPVDVAKLMAASKRGDVAAPGLSARGQDALTFDAAGRITRLVFSGGC
jgi:hypothetical protein